MIWRSSFLLHSQLDTATFTYDCTLQGTRICRQGGLLMWQLSGLNYDWFASALRVGCCSDYACIHSADLVSLVRRVVQVGA